jgi:cysteine synthase
MHELLKQLNFTYAHNSQEPQYFVHAAGTGETRLLCCMTSIRRLLDSGGTISSVGRYLKKHGLPTQVVMADTEYSVYYDYVSECY